MVGLTANKRKTELFCGLEKNRESDTLVRVKEVDEKGIERRGSKA